MAALLSLNAYAADAGPGKFLGGKEGAVLVADLATGGRFAESTPGASGRAAPPASVFKAAAALALAREGRGGPVWCPGTYVDRGRRRFCTEHRGHGAMTLRRAFARSCNLYFRSRAPEGDALLSAGRELGLVRAEDLPALAEASPADLALGLPAELAMTPPELLEAALRWPASPAWRTLQPLLEACVKEGTCAPARVTGLAVAGKTGTAPAPDGSGATSGWFVGFSPADRPRAAVVVFLDRGRGDEAAAVGGRALAWWFKRSSP